MLEFPNGASLHPYMLAIHHLSRRLVLEYMISKWDTSLARRRLWREICDGQEDHIVLAAKATSCDLSPLAAALGPKDRRSGGMRSAFRPTPRVP